MTDPGVVVDAGDGGGTEDAGPQNIADAIDLAFAEPVEEATSPDTPEPESEDSPPSEPDDSSPPRNEKGQFVKKDEESTEDPPADEAAEPEAEPEATDEDVATDEPETEVEADAEAEPEPEPAPDLPEFTFKVDGRDFSIPGSKVGEDGIFIPRAEVERTQRLIGLGQHSKQRDRDYGRELAAAKAEGGEQSRINNEIFDRLLEARKDPDRLYALLDPHNQDQFDLMVANSKIAALEAGDTKRGEQDAADTKERDVADLQPKLESGVANAVDEALKDARYAGVDGDEVKARLKQQYSMVFHTVRSEDAIPEGMAPIARYQQGTVVIDLEHVKGELEYAAGVVRRATVQAEAVSKVAKKNRERLAPKAVSTKKAPPPPKPKPAPKEMTGQEAIEHTFGEGWKDL